MRTAATAFRSLRTAGTSALAVLSLVGCKDLVRTTELAPEGAPEVLQVFVRERIEHEHEDGSKELVLEPRLAFGDHPDISEDDDDRVAEAAVVGTDQKIRIVIDELMRGNSLEEIACADGETFSRVPIGTTPDDVAKCTGKDLSKCTKLCVGIGVLDANNDGGVDDTRLIEGAVSLRCGGDVPVNRDESFYQPSGNQLIPAGDLGLDGLGPAIVIVPEKSLPTGTACTIELGAEVVDKDGIRPCTPSADGTCTPGDMSALTFTTEALQLVGTDPHDGAEDVALTAEAKPDATIHVQINGWVNADTALAPGTFTLTAGDAPVAGIAVAMSEHDPSLVEITVPGGFTAATTYKLTIATGIKDTYGAALPEVSAITWKTKAAAIAGH